MKSRYLLTLGLCLLLTAPALAQRPGGQQQQQQQNSQKSKEKTRDQSRERTQQQQHERTQQQQQQQQHNRPQVQQQQRQQQQTRPQVQQQQRQQQQTRPQVQQQERQRTQQQTRPQVQQQERRQNRERFTAPNAPQRRAQRNAQPQYYRAPDGRVDRRPMYRNGVWYGRSAPNDPRYRLRQPYVHGHFYRYGPRYYHRIVRFNQAHYWFWLASGYYFQIAYWDWPYCSDWCWTCGDDYLIYLDPDHVGWYLILNVQTGVYVHAIFMGR